jgi:hypothetical protein
MSNDENKSLLPVTKDEIAPFFQRLLLAVREDMRENPYILEAIRVLPVGGYRSAIGSFWNAVVDDLRNKIIFRSLPLFNKTMNVGKEVKTYEDFQNFVNDDMLIEGAYKIGVIGWEASKILKHAKENRHIFDGHPRSSEPSIIKVLAMMDDCIKYVLNAEYPSQIIDIDDYMTMIGDNNFDRNAVAVENAIGDLPEMYKNELANRLFTAYVHPQASTVLRSNIEFVAPILWNVLPRDVKIQITRRVDQELTKGNAIGTEQAFSFVRVVGSTQYLSPTSRKYKLAPVIETLQSNLDNFHEENTAVRELAPYAAFIPQDLVAAYVSALTHTYVGRVGYSLQFSRTDFYADQAALMIPKMFEAFDDRAAQAFVDTIKSSTILKDRIHTAAKLRRLRALGNIVTSRISANFADQEFLQALVSEDEEEKFFAFIKS